MPLRNIDIKQLLRLCEHRKTPFNIRFALLLTLVVFIQQLSSNFLHARFGSINHYAAVTASQLKEKVPSQDTASHLQLDIEVETAEEDDVEHLHQQHYGYIPKHFGIEEFHYTAFIKSCFLRLAFNASQADSCPLFVLHHAWKTDLA